MTGNKIFDCQQMFRHACAFAEVADMAEMKFCHDTADIEWYITPSIVNSAFACEVYLKALLFYFDIPLQKQHKLKELYDMMPGEIRKSIKATVINRYGGWKDPFGFDLLDGITDAFIKWRYSYEIEKSLYLDTVFLYVFRNALRAACCQLFFGKAWEEYLAN